MGGEVGFGLGLPSGDGALFVATGGVVGGFPTGPVTFDVCRLQPMNAMVMNVSRTPVPDGKPLSLPPLPYQLRPA